MNDGSLAGYDSVEKILQVIVEHARCQHAAAAVGSEQVLTPC